MDNNTTKPYLDRMHEECKQLKERIDKLAGFIHESDIFKGLPRRKQILMEQQFHAMALYEHILAERITLEEQDN